MADLSGYKLTGGDTPFATGDPRTFPAGYNDIIDEVMRLDTAKAETSTTDALASDIADRVLKAGDTLTGDFVFRNTPVNIQFSDPAQTANFFFHYGNGNFFFLFDLDGDGTWATPYPMKVTPDAIEFWDGGNEVHLTSDGIINTSLGSEANPAYGFRGATAGFYNNSGYLSAAMSGERTLHIATNQLVGIGDNTKNLGNSSHRWKAVWAVDGTINSSDASTKEDIVDSDLGLDFIKALRPRKNRRVGGNRPHYNLIAQEVKQTIDNMGIDFAGYVDPAVTFMEDEYTEGIFEEPGALSLRYDEFLSPMIKAIQELSARVDAVEAGSPGGGP